MPEIDSRAVPFARRTIVLEGVKKADAGVLAPDVTCELRPERDLELSLSFFRRTSAPRPLRLSRRAMLCTGEPGPEVVGASDD